jgi:hypothetical protein
MIIIWLYESYGFSGSEAVWFVFSYPPVVPPRPFPFSLMLHAVFSDCTPFISNRHAVRLIVEEKQCSVLPARFTGLFLWWIYFLKFIPKNTTCHDACVCLGTKHVARKRIHLDHSETLISSDAFQLQAFSFTKRFTLGKCMWVFDFRKLKWDQAMEAEPLVFVTFSVGREFWTHLRSRW